MGTALDNRNIESFMSQEVSKVVLFTNRTFTPVSFKGLSSYYKGWMEFGVVYSNSTDILEQYKIESFP